MLIKLDIFKHQGRYTGWRILSIFVIGILTASFLATTFFIYQNIMATTANSSIIIILGPESNIEVLNMADYEKAKNIVAQKQQATFIANDLKYIFDFQTSTVKTTTAYAPTTTKK